jgi:hypothetical protein
MLESIRPGFLGIPGGAGPAIGWGVMKRARLTFASFFPAGRCCNPLGLLLAGLLVVTLTQLAKVLGPGSLI